MNFVCSCNNHFYFNSAETLPFLNMLSIEIFELNVLEYLTKSKIYHLSFVHRIKNI